MRRGGRCEGKEEIERGGECDGMQDLSRISIPRRWSRCGGVYATFDCFFVEEGISREGGKEKAAAALHIWCSRAVVGIFRARTARCSGQV